ncbi:hypothetical protein BH10PLA1_BH10PLA1_15750 [soil metagenome]
MSEDPDKPSVIPYAKPPAGSLPIGVQAFLGALVTLLVIALFVFVGGFVAMMITSDLWRAIALGVAAVIVSAIGLRKARNQRDYFNRRGWEIGIYIGLGLGALLWGWCGIFIYSFNHSYH